MFNYLKNSIILNSNLSNLYFRYYTKSKSSQKVIINKGIKLISSNLDVVFISKTSNVGVYSNQLIKNAASISIADWSRNFNNNNNNESSPEIFTNLAINDSGIVSIAISELGKAVLAKCLKYSTYIYTAVISINDGIRVDKDMYDISVNKETFTMIISLNSVISSGSYNNLSLCTIKINPIFDKIIDNDNFNIPNIKQIKEILNDLNFKCVSINDNKNNDCISLTNICLNASLLSKLNINDLVNNSNQSIELTKDNHMKISISTPSKFLKFINRELILFNRIQEKSNQININYLINIKYHGLNIEIPHDSLHPRESSYCLVLEAISHLHVKYNQLIVKYNKDKDLHNNIQSSNISKFKDKKKLNVLELGCGSGALLLSIVKEFDTINGIGVDLDHSSLLCANNNLIRNKLDNNNNNNNNNNRFVSFHKIDFSLLNRYTWDNNGIPSLSSQIDDANNIVTKNASNSFNEGFDVIICNPPFLSNKSVQGRITNEGGHALVSGITGFEAYESICKSISILCTKDSKLSNFLNKNDGIIIFQIPINGYNNVERIIMKHGFQIIKIINDGSGKQRGIIIKWIGF